MSEKQLLKDIAGWRRQAIHNSDVKYSKMFTAADFAGSRKPVLIVGFLYLILVALFTLYLFWTIAGMQRPEQPERVLLINNTHTIQEKPIEVKHTFYNYTKVEHVIKGEKQMTCISQPNSSWITCYKEASK